MPDPHMRDRCLHVNGYSLQFLGFFPRCAYDVAMQLLWIALFWLGLGVFDAMQTVLVMHSEGMHHVWLKLFLVTVATWLPWALATPGVLLARPKIPAARPARLYEMASARCGVHRNRFRLCRLDHDPSRDLQSLRWSGQRALRRSGARQIRKRYALLVRALRGHPHGQIRFGFSRAFGDLANGSGPSQRRPFQSATQRVAKSDRAALSLQYAQRWLGPDPRRTERCRGSDRRRT